MVAFAPQCAVHTGCFWVSVQYTGRIQGNFVPRRSRLFALGFLLTPTSPLVIHGPNQAEYDEDLGVIMANDWYHSCYADVVANTTMPVPPGQAYRPFANSNHLGGVGRYPCENVTDGSPCTTVPYASWKVEPGKTYRSRFINTGSSSFEVLSIDNHKLTIIANDFIPIQP